MSLNIEMADANNLHHYTVTFEHPAHKTVSIYRMELDGSKPIRQLKEALAEKLKTQASDQKWSSRSNVLDNCMTLDTCNVPHEGGFIEVSVITSGGGQTRPFCS